MVVYLSLSKMVFLYVLGVNIKYGLSLSFFGH